MTDRKCYVYIIAKFEDGEFKAPVKVGVANAPHVRLNGFKTACPFPIDIVAKFRVQSREQAFDLERTFHRVYRARRLHGEWFDIDPFNAEYHVRLWLCIFLIHAGNDTDEKLNICLEWCGTVPLRAGELDAIKEVIGMAKKGSDQ